MAALNLIHVYKNINSNAILKDIHISIEKGEFITVVGPSGCGKSTLLRLIAGLDHVSTGKILINNECVNQLSASKRDMAMVFQNYALYPHMTVFDNMGYGLKMRKYSKKEIQKRVTESAEMLQLSDYLDRKPDELSGGQRQRVAMGRAMVRSPAVFLFDEPLSNLDAKLRTQMRHEIKSLHKRLGTTSIYVTHDQTEAMTMADRIIVLNQGQVEQIGTPSELYQQPASMFVADFTGHYPMNFIKATYHSSEQSIYSECGLSFVPEGNQLKDGQSVTLAVRAEHLLLADKNKEDSVQLKVEFIDDMGADKLVQAIDMDSGSRITVRTGPDWMPEGDKIRISLPEKEVHLYDEYSGKRIER